MTVEGRGAVTCRHAPWAVTLTTAGARLPTVRRSSPDFSLCQSFFIGQSMKEIVRFYCSFICLPSNGEV